MPRANDPPVAEGLCYLCKRKVYSNDGWCFGCCNWICNDCEKFPSVASESGHGHDVEDHFEYAYAPEEGEDE